MELSSQVTEPTLTEESELLECLRKIGKGMIASGVSVGVVENTLTEIALAYGVEGEIVALPNVIMIERALMHILSGSARLIYGAAVLLLLFIGIAIGLNLSGLSSAKVTTYEAVIFSWWAPVVGTLLFGVRTFIRLSGANRDLFWMLLGTLVVSPNKFVPVTALRDQLQDQGV
jgi:hypothetical protein